MENKISMVAKFPKHIRPLADRIIIYPDQGDDTFGGRGIIHVPDNKKFKKTKGTVVAVGNGKYFKDMIIISPAVIIPIKSIFLKSISNFRLISA